MPRRDNSFVSKNFLTAIENVKPARSSRHWSIYRNNVCNREGRQGREPVVSDPTKDLENWVKGNLVNNFLLVY